ncbi:MAG: ATP-binding cassette domain-containing protein [Myxococcales bacterium]|nr:ATP-binding cassette domain-containing protein [Myxococcales bacterium]
MSTRRPRETEQPGDRTLEVGEATALLPALRMPEERATVLRVDSVTCWFGDHCVLDRVSLEVREGEVVGIIGPGGVGKTVLVKLCTGLLEPDSGRIDVLGNELGRTGQKDRQRLRERIGLVFQNYALFDFMTVGQNVAFPMLQRGGYTAEDVATRVQERLTEVGLPKVQHLMPNELSGGMKKRVGLARANINDPELIFFDDPTAGLDPVTSSKIFNLIRLTQSHRNSTCVVISHDIDRMRPACDRYVLLYKSRVYFEGTEADAMASEDAVVHEFFRKNEGIGA